VALLVATYEYQDSGLRRLTAPAHDAEALGQVLADPDIGGFEVTTSINQPHYRVGEAIGDFYRDRRRDDLALLYFTGHGLKDDTGNLYLAMTNTRRDSLLFTALPAEQIDQAMSGTNSRQTVLILDCCYSGAFPAGHLAKGDTEVHALERFHGRGRTVLTASDSTQYSFEGNRLTGDATQSVFTRHMIAGLRDGSADIDGDGNISVDELYTYVHDRVVEEMPQQRPKKQTSAEGQTILARNVNWSMPAYLRNAIDSPIAHDRLGALERLDHLYRIGNETVRARVLDEVRGLADDDSRQVLDAAKTWLETVTHGASGGKPTGTPPVGSREDVTLPAGPPSIEAAPSPTDEELVPAGPSPTLLAPSPHRRRPLVVLAAAVAVAAATVGIVLVLPDGGEGSGSRGAASPSGSAPSGSASQPIGEPGLYDVAVGQTGQRVYVSNRQTNAMSVIDTSTNKLIGRIAVGKQPLGVAIGTGRGYAVNHGSNSVTEINTVTLTPVGGAIPVGERPLSLAFIPHTRPVLAYVTNSGGSTVSVVDLDANKQKTTINVGSNPWDVAVDTEHGLAYVANRGSRSVTVINTATHRPIDDLIPSGEFPENLAVNSVTSRLYVTHGGSAHIAVVDTATRRSIGDSITLGSVASDLTVSKDGKRLYVTLSSTDQVVALDTGTRQPIGAPIPVGDGPTGIALSGDGRHVYIANTGSGTVSVIDTATNKTTGQPIPVPR
jgi:YVTN family beta-propeller protein